ncbi:MAG: hypothetical protein ABIN97_19725 [Ginsengibacter sp.]
MKLRFEKNSVRYRIRKTELEQLKQDGFVQEIITFKDATLTYQLLIDETDDLYAEFSNNKVAIHIPLNIANTFINTDEVGVYKSMPLNNNEVLDIIIEKDFPCKDGPEEDRSDKFSELAEKDGRDDIC